MNTANLALVALVCLGVAACEGNEKKLQRLKTDEAFLCTIARSDTSATSDSAQVRCDLAQRELNKFMSGR